MKRIITLLLALAMALSLAACGASDAGQTGDSQTEAPETSAPETAPEAEPAPETPDAPAEEAPAEDGAASTILVAYFSWSGNTETLANMVWEAAGGDLFEIVPETPYTDDYNDLLDVAQEEQRTGARPALAADVDTWDDYDTIFVGYPNWWGNAPMIILSFLESHDCTGKTIVPFATSGGGGLGRGVASITDSANGATVLDGFHVSGSSVGGAAADVADWVAGLGL